MSELINEEEIEKESFKLFPKADLSNVKFGNDYSDNNRTGFVSGVKFAESKMKDLIIEFTEYKDKYYQKGKGAGGRYILHTDNYFAKGYSIEQIFNTFMEERQNG